MSIHISINKQSEDVLIREIKQRFSDAIGNTMYALTGNIKSLYDRNTPKLSGALRRNTEIGVKKSDMSALMYIRYKQPYARYQYVNHFQNYSTPGTDGEWDKYSHDEVKELIHSELVKQLKMQFR